MIVPNPIGHLPTHNLENYANDPHLTETPFNIEEGSPVWVEDPDLAWIEGEVTKLVGENVEIKTSNESTVTAKLSKVCIRDKDAPESGVDDMANLSYLNEPGVLHNLATRYQLDEIYTYIGNILIAINPFQRLPHLYDLQMMNRYKGVPLRELKPHVFAIADVAYREMINEKRSNSILVSGESGAGKTETTKMLMQYLAYLGGHKGTEGRTVEQKVLESNPVLEAFGNAKTVKNNNSSRFGKFVEIQFDRHGRISGAAIRTYLLERSRVCQLSDPERNYHCFYFLCAAPKEEVEKYKLADPSSFHYLNQSNCYDLVGINDAQEYLDTRRAMDIIGISIEEQDAIFRVVASILHLGNIEFDKGQENDSSALKDEKSKFHLQTTAELLMCNPKALEDALLKRVMVTPEEVIKRSLDPAGAIVSRDGLAKTIYSRLFEWLVDKINHAIGQDPNSKSLIGVLDIYGFESFKANSFEQFCINYTNEKLQQHFNQHVFKMEQEEYANEVIDWSYVEFIDNQDILDLIEKKPGGIIALLDEACMFPKSTQETFSHKLYQMFKNNRRFIKPKRSLTDFTISHYAGEVQYQSDQFLDKNKDYIVPEHLDLLTASKCPFVIGLFPTVIEESPKFSSKSSKFSSIGSRVKLQLQKLMETLKSTEPHYIRCVKPNNLLKPALIENVNVAKQLRCSGVLEVIKVSCAGFPTHKTFLEFLNRFGRLAPEFLEGSYDEKESCKHILDKMGLTGYQIGKTKVFLRSGQMADLDSRRAHIVSSSARTIQKRSRGHIARKNYVSLLKAAVDVQSLCRGGLARDMHKNKKLGAASVKVQKKLRGHLVRKTFANLKLVAIVLQTGIRAMSSRNELRCRRQNRAATKIQAHWRCHRSASYYQKLKRATILTQSRWRGRVARRELHELKMAATGTGPLKDINDKLEKQVEDLSILEQRLRTDLEDAKDEEITKLQQSLQAMQKKLDESNALLAKKCKAHKKEIEEVSSVDIVKGTPVEEVSSVDIVKGTPAEEVSSVDIVKGTPAEEVSSVDIVKGTPAEEVSSVDIVKGTPAEEVSSVDIVKGTPAEEVSSVDIVKETPAEEVSSIDIVKETPVSLEPSVNSEPLRSEMENLKVLLNLEKHRADDLEKRYAEAQGSNREKRQQLEETEKRVHQLQESLNRMIYNMSDRFSELKLILSGSYNASSSSGVVVGETLGDDTSSSSSFDSTSTDSDFTFPAPSPNPANFSSSEPGGFQLIVQDLSAAEIPGSENGESDREGAFDEFF